MTERDVGDTATLTLTVAPSAVDTTAVVLVTAPGGTTSTPSTSPNVDRSVWTAQAPLSAAGEWVAVWTVTGTGAGVEQQAITVRPLLPVTIAGQRVYATTVQLADWLEAAPPDGARRKLASASRLVDRALLTAVYDVDENDLPTDARIAAALRDAVCAQVEYWADGGITPSGADAVYTEVAIGSARLRRAPTASPPGSPRRLCAEAAEILTDAVDTDGRPLLAGVITTY